MCPWWAVHVRARTELRLSGSPLETRGEPVSGSEIGGEKRDGETEGSGLLLGAERERGG